MATKKEFIAQEVAKAVGAGKAVSLETVDFNDPNRPKTCLEVDFPILPVNSLAAIEASSGGTKKPIYQMSKWWARRQPSVFRSLLIAAATKAPDDPSHAAKLVWDNYYGNHQKKGAFKHLKVADIFMGGGTTLVEGSRLGMQMSGNDLNPVAWFVVKQALSNVEIEQVEALLAEIEDEVRPQIMPFYYCDGPNGEKGTWTHKPSGKVMSENFDPLSLTSAERKNYGYIGPEIIYTFWAKHGPCQVTGCGHRTPIMTSPTMAVKSISVKHWKHSCKSCGNVYDVEDAEARMAPDVPLYVAPSEKPYSILSPSGHCICPSCGHVEIAKLGKGKNKKVSLTLLVHPEWLAGSPKAAPDGSILGGSAQDDATTTEQWNDERAKNIKLLEVRGNLPNEVTCPVTNVTFAPDNSGGTVPKRSTFVCGKCGTAQDVLKSIKATKKTGPMASYAIHGYSPNRKAPYSGRFFSPFNLDLAKQYNAAVAAWEARKHADLEQYWPKSEIPYGFMTHQNNGGIPNHGFTHWHTMFNPRQLLVISQLLKAITTAGNYEWAVREFVLSVFQQYIRNQCMFTIWNKQADQLEPMFSNNNFHPKSTVVENNCFAPYGRGNWHGCKKSLRATLEWSSNPWETVAKSNLLSNNPDLEAEISGKSEKVYPNDGVGNVELRCASSTDLDFFRDASLDLIVTDPPFGGLLHYSELSDYFYVWLKLALAEKHPDVYGDVHTPKALEAVSNKAREPEDPDGFYKRLLTSCWKEAFRVLRPGGMLAFTFHHSADEPWVAVLESLFDAGFYLEATYPIRSDETKGEGSKPGTFGSQQIEYDIIHVCRKRTEEPKEVSWGRMRREVLADVKQLQGMLENHAKAGLPAADLQVIRRGKALEYFSRHYGKVYVDEGRAISVKDALVGINQLIDEDSFKGSEPPPLNAEPITRQFLRIFDGKSEVARDQMQKMMRGSGIAPDEFTGRNWAYEEKKVFHFIDPLEFAQDWQGKHKRRLTSDLDQALVLIGACYDGSGINASDTLKNENFKPHAALKRLLEWLAKRAPNQTMRNASSRAMTIYNSWAEANKAAVAQMSLFLEDGA